MAAARTTSRNHIQGSRGGSALILTLVLTSLLAIVGVLFVMMARIERMASSSASENQELNLAVSTVVARISEALVADVPGVFEDQEYYDYPDPNNAWLADMEPYASGGEYYWRQISDLTGVLAGDATDVLIEVVAQHEAITDVNTAVTDADADGDGVGDARWVRVPGVMSGRGRPIYAAVRIIDNGGMLNVNTGYVFDPNDADESMVDGTSALQVNLMALAAEPNGVIPSTKRTQLLAARANYGNGVDVLDLAAYEAGVMWRYDGITDPYTPFDLSDELELRYRYLLNHTGIDTRVEAWGRLRGNTISTPVYSSGEAFDEWFRRANGGGLDPNYAYRHITTTRNMDRIITPSPIPLSLDEPSRKMVNVNDASLDELQAAVAVALGDAFTAREMNQIVVNLADYIDEDSDISYGLFAEDPNYDPALAQPDVVYGFERPCIYVSELAYRYTSDEDANHVSYGIELYRPYDEDANVPLDGQWRLKVNDEIKPIEWSAPGRFHVMMQEDPAAPLFAEGQERPPIQDVNMVFQAGDRISLQRISPYPADEYLTVDEVIVPDGWFADVNEVAVSIQRDTTDHYEILRSWADANDVAEATLGAANTYVDTRPVRERMVQAHPLDGPLTSIGEIGMVFAKGAYCIDGEDPFTMDLIGYAEAADTPEEVVINLQSPLYADLFNHLTVIDPAARGHDLDETRVKGRINVNTAPWFVIGQLPWMQYEDGDFFEKALATTEYRDTHGAYQSIADLMQVTDLHELSYDTLDNQFEDTPPGPDLTLDTAQDDLEERDILFTRISNLVTVRSDLFTAYILVRIGTGGPQKRMLALLDRSEVLVPSDKVRILALQAVPDPR